MRNTELDLDGVLTCIQNGNGPRCMLVNEIGQIALSSGEEALHAQQELAKLLKSGVENDRWIAVRFLRNLEGARIPEVDAAYKAFAADPANSSDMEN